MKQSAVSPDCADLFLRSKIFERFEMPAITVGANGVAAEALELTMAVVAVTFDDCLHDCMALPPTWRSVHGCLILLSLCSMVCSRQRVWHMYILYLAVGPSACRRQKPELDSFVGENAVDAERGGSYKGLQKDQHGDSAGLRDELHKGTLARAVGCNIQV